MALNRPNHCTAESCKDCKWVAECWAAQKRKPQTCHICGQRTDGPTQAMCPTCRGGRVFGENLNIGKAV